MIELLFLMASICADSECSVVQVSETTIKVDVDPDLDRKHSFPVDGINIIVK